MNRRTFIRCIAAAAGGSALSTRGAVARTQFEAGYREIMLPTGAAGGPARKLFLWYPTDAEPRALRYGGRGGQEGWAAPDAPIPTGQHPVIVFSHGYTGVGNQVIFLTEALARAGYIVAAINHADARFGFGRQLDRPGFADYKSWTDAKFTDRRDDIRLLIDHLLAQSATSGSWLSGRVDPRHIGAAGHSLGGYTVLGLAGAWKSWRDKRIKSVLALSPYALPFIDKGTAPDLQTPVMLQGGTLDLGITPFLPPLYDKLPSPKYFLVLKDETHLAWTNFSTLNRRTTEALKTGNVRRIAEYSVAFFDRHLLGKQPGPDGLDILANGDGLQSFQRKV